MLKVQNITKTFGSQTLFNEISFTINPKERIGLVGRNGHGKTTLLRMIIGEEQPDDGMIDIPKNYRIGYVSQHLTFSSSTVLEEASLGLAEHEKDEHWKAEKILFGLGYTEEDLGRSPDEFSGGFQVRLNLAKVLVSEPDLLLLDEPTNYLDITSIRWLIQFLRSWQHELLLITHDRSFMDAVITHTVAIHRQKVKKIQGNTEKLYEQIAKEEEIHEKTRLNDEKKRKETEQFINRFRAKARLAGLVQSRIKQLEKMEKKDKLARVANLDFSFTDAPFAGKTIMTVEQLAFGYEPAMLLIEDFGITVHKHDRICIIGKNGKGKTTLLKLLAGALEAQRGEIRSHPQVEMGYFAQTNISTLEDNRTVLEEIAAGDSSADNQQVRNISGAMLFEGDKALKKIKVLSGGEKSRVMLGKVLLKPVNLLLLDEPTNHFDMQSADSLLQAIDSFDGAVVMVTHNEMFLHALATRLIVFKNEQVSVFDGSYEEFLEKKGWDDEEPAPKKSAAAEKNEVVNKKEMRKIRSEIIARKSKILKPLEKSIERLEATIPQEEDALSALQQELVKASEQGEASLIAEFSRKCKSLELAIEEHYDELEQATLEHETLLQEFDREIGCFT